MKNEDFAKRFRALVDRAGAPTTQVALGKFLGVSGNMAWCYLNGEKLPAMTNAISIAEKLNCCVEYLLSGRGPIGPCRTGQPEIDLSSIDEESAAAILHIYRLAKAKCPEPDLCSSPNTGGKLIDVGQAMQVHPTTPYLLGTPYRRTPQ
jgi:DNA-binding XRE family transcriptional regulator